MPMTEKPSINRSELVESIATKFDGVLPQSDIEQAVKVIQQSMSDTLAHGGRIEIRGFGSFSLHYRKPRLGRNPKTGEKVALAGKHVPHFKAGKELRLALNQGNK